MLSRVAAVEEQFDSPPSDMMEQRRRDELILYVMIMTLLQVQS
jgi:hypothetical protein